MESTDRRDRTTCTVCIIFGLLVGRAVLQLRSESIQKILELFRLFCSRSFLVNFLFDQYVLFLRFDRTAVFNLPPVIWFRFNLFRSVRCCLLCDF